MKSKEEVLAVFDEVLKEYVKCKGWDANKEAIYKRASVALRDARELWMAEAYHSQFQQPVKDVSVLVNALTEIKIYGDRLSVRYASKALSKYESTEPVKQG